MRGQPHEETIKNLKEMGICAEARKKLDIPVLQRDGTSTFYPTSIDVIVQEILDAILRKAVWIPDQNASLQEPPNGM